MTIIICAFCAIMNILVAMNSTNPEVWVNWMSSGFCFGLMVAAIVMKMRR